MNWVIQKLQRPQIICDTFTTSPLLCAPQNILCPSVVLSRYPVCVSLFLQSRRHLWSLCKREMCVFFSVCILHPCSWSLPPPSFTTYSPAQCCHPPRFSSFQGFYWLDQFSLRQPRQTGINVTTVADYLLIDYRTVTQACFELCVVYFLEKWKTTTHLKLPRQITKAWLSQCDGWTTLKRFFKSKTKWHCVSFIYLHCDTLRCCHGPYLMLLMCRLRS